MNEKILSEARATLKTTREPDDTDVDKEVYEDAVSEDPESVAVVSSDPGVVTAEIHLPPPKPVRMGFLRGSRTSYPLRTIAEEPVSFTKLCTEV